MLALKQYFAGRQITILMLDDHAAGGDLQVQSIAHGVINIEAVTSEYGAERAPREDRQAARRQLHGWLS